MKIIIAEDHPVLVDGLKKLLEEIEGIQVLDAVSNGRLLISRLRQAPADMVLLDLHMPQMDGLETLKIVRVEFPRLKVLVFTNYNQPKLLREIKMLGATGWVLKSSSSPTLKDAIRAIANGDTWFRDELPDEAPSDLFINDFMKKYQITPREVEIIRKVAAGYTSKQIGKELYVSEFTVNAHRRNICRKLEISNAAGLVSFAKEHGLI
jgi:DNA-binding NarL/FixJ family response regulator